MPPSHIVCVGDIPLLHRRGCSSSPRLVQPLRKVVFFLPWKNFTIRCRSAVSDGDVSLKGGSHYCKYSGGTRPAAWKTHFPNTALLLAADLSSFSCRRRRFSNRRRLHPLTDIKSEQMAVFSGSSSKVQRNFLLVSRWGG